MNNINCTVAKIRKCNGVIIEVLTTEPERKMILDEIFKLQKEGYHIYGLRHLDNDWSRPYSISNGNTLVNRFGWFCTKDKMEFKNKSEVNLSSANSKFYAFSDKNDISTIQPVNKFYYSTEVSINTFYDNYDAIIKLLNDSI